MEFPLALPEPASLLSGTGYGSDSDDSHFFKRPPHLPFMDKGDLGLTLLPFIRLPAEWRTRLPGWHWYHWFASESDAEAGVTIVIRLNQSAPVFLHLAPWEYRELAKNMLNTHQLLQWLAYKLSGRETFIQTLMDMAAVMSEQEDLDETLFASLEEQIMVALEQPDREFSLEFEIQQLVETFSSIALASPESGISHLPIGKTGDKPQQLPAGQGSEQSLKKEKASGDRSDLSAGQNQRHNGEGNKPPPQPTGSVQALGAGAQVLEDYFGIVVNGTEFRIRKEQLPPLKRGRGNISEIKVYKPENPGETLLLSGLEERAGLPKCSWLIEGSTPLDYLLAYGSESTRKALQHYYPVNLISEREGHLMADSDYRGYAVDDRCPICLDPLLSRKSLTHCTHDQRHIFHTSCFQHWFQQSREDVNPGANKLKTACPECNEEQSPELRSLFSPGGLKQELHRAAKTGNLAVLTALLESGADREATDEQGNTALHLAAQAGHSEIVLLLTEEGANFKAINHAGQLPVVVAEHPGIIDILKQAQQNPSIFFTVGHSREEALRQWLADGNDPGLARHSDGASLLHIAAESNSLDTGRQLLRTSMVTLVDKRDIHGATPLHLAASSGNLEVVLLLLDYKSNVDATTKTSATYDARVTPLTLAIENNHPAIVKALVYYGAEVNAPSTGLISTMTMDESDQHNKGSDPVSGSGTSSLEIELPALLKAACMGHSEVVKVFLDAGADINQEVRGCTALYLAIKNDHPEVVKTLLKAGAAPNAPGPDSLLILAAQESSAKVIKILLEYYVDMNPSSGAPVNVPSPEHGFTPLTIAASAGYTDVVDKLLEYGANVDMPVVVGTRAMEACIAGGTIKDYPEQWRRAGVTALMQAANEGNIDIVRKLLEHNANVNKTTMLDSGTAIMFSAMNGHLEVTRELVEHGAKVNAESDGGETALMLAARGGHTEVVEYLLTHGAHVHHKRKSDHVSALIMAATVPNPDVPGVLLKYGADVNDAADGNVTALVMAARGGHYDNVRVLLESGARPDAANNQGCFALRLAVLNKHSRVVRVLLESGVDANSTNRHGEPELIVAALLEDFETVTAFLDNGAYVNQTGSSGHTALTAAATKGNSEVVEALLEHGADVNFVLPDGCTALIIAAQKNHPEVVSILLNSGVTVDHAGHNGVTALLLAAKMDRPEVAELLLKHHADVNFTLPDGRTALSVAAEKGNSEVIKVLLEYNAEIDKADTSGFTPLITAALNGQLETTRILLAANAEVNACTIENGSALFAAAQAGAIEIVRLLLDRGADVHQAKAGGFTPLSVAATKGHREVSSVLIETGAVVDCVSDNGATPLLLSAEQGQHEVAELLLQYHADVNFLLPDGRNALMLAAQQNHSEVAKVLIRHDADLNYSIHGMTALMLAVLSGHINVATVLVNHGADLDRPGDDGKTDLAVASQQGRSESVRALDRCDASMSRNHPPDENTPLLPVSQDNERSGCADLILDCFGSRTED